MYKRIENLENVKVGDVFLSAFGSYSQIYDTVTCTKVTPKQAEIGGCTYWKHNAVRVGNYSGSYPLYEASPHEVEYARLKEIRRKVENTSLHTLSDDKIKQIWAVINGGEDA